MVKFFDSNLIDIIPIQFLLVNKNLMRSLFTNYLEIINSNLDKFDKKQQQRQIKTMAQTLKNELEADVDMDDWLEYHNNFINFDFTYELDTYSLLVNTLKSINKNIDIFNNKISSKYLILPFNKYSALYIKYGMVPLLTDTIVDLIPLDKYKKNSNDFFEFSLKTGLFEDILTIDELESLYKNLKFGDELDMDRFLYCAEELLNINIVMLSNKFPMCEKCNKYIFTSLTGNRVIRENRDIHFIYRFVDENDISVYYAIKFLDIENEKIINNINEFSYTRLIQKYNENNEMLEIKKVEFEPTDIGRDLPIIEFNLEIENKVHSIKLYVGSTYNLYSMNRDLVGRLDLVGIKDDNGFGNIEWIEKYPQKLLS